MSLEGKRTSCLDLRFRANLISLLTLRVIFPPPDRRCDKVKHSAARFTPDRVINATRSLALCFSRDSLQNKQTDRLANKQTDTFLFFVLRACTGVYFSLRYWE